MNPLLALPSATLALISGELRKRLVRYLTRWHYDDVLLRYFDSWLVEQPTSVGLREGRARALIELGRGDAALVVLAGIDAERSPTATRRQLRWRALIAAHRFADLHAALDAQPDDPDQQVYLQLLRGDAMRAEGKLDDAARAYEAALALDPLSLAATRRLAELALQRSEPEVTRGLIDALMLRPDFTPGVAELEILAQAAAMSEDPAADSLRAQLAALEASERDALLNDLGARQQPAAEAADVVIEPVVEAALPEEAYAVLRDHFGFSVFRPNQTRVIASVLSGKATLAIMPTGAGKSLTYQIPAMLLPQATVVVSPLIALMKDQIESLPASLRERATVINSSISGAEVAARLRDIAAGEYKLVYIAPERLRQRAFLHALKRSGVSLFVVDEAHCVSLWGLSFRPDYLFIKEAFTELGSPPLLALTATASDSTQAEIRRYLGAAELVSASVFRPNLYVQVQRAGNREEKDQSVVELCRRIAGSIIVYARARQTCEELADLLRRSDIPAEHYHAQVPDRDAVQERFMRGQTRVLVATVAFGMGIDKADIRAIIHYNLPQSVEAYFQEAGRAGRDGQPARCILLYAASDKARLTSWLQEEALTREQLRALYRALRRQIGERYGIVDLDLVQREVGGDDETLLRVGMSMLERVGLLRRHFDLPVNATVTLRRGVPPDERASQLLEIGRLVPEEAVEIDLIAYAEQFGYAPSDFEAQLLEWHDQGFLRYRGGQRGVLLELRPAPPDVAERIDKLLAEYEAQQLQRVEALASYARSSRCRHSVLAAHFGQRLGRCRTACDICAPEGRVQLAVRASQRAAPQPLPPRDESDPRDDRQRILDGLAHVPFGMGRSGLAKVLKGGANSPIEAGRCSEHGALRHLSQSAIEDMIEELIGDGYIHRDDLDEYRRLSLTTKSKK
jgi:ATP-dependent DNA helicase RecQ